MRPSREKKQYMYAGFVAAAAVLAVLLFFSEGYLRESLPLLFLLLFLFLIRGRGYIFRDIARERKLIFSLARNDIRSRYAGAVMGAVWAFIQPMLTILVMWYVFQVGFRNPPVKDVPFIVWFVSGYVPWMFFNEGISSITNSVTDYSYLVKKIRFRVSVLPAIRLLASFYIHLFFIGITFLILLISGFHPQWIWLQAFYYSFCTAVLVFSLGLIFSSLTVLFRDTGQVVLALLQILFWYTPIVWSYDSLNTSVRRIFAVNPVFYVVQGYRNTFIDHIWFWQDSGQNALFWGTAFVFLSLGILLFHRFRPHFSDLL